MANPVPEETLRLFSNIRSQGISIFPKKENCGYQS